MFATPRHALSLALAGAVVLGGVTPAFASDQISEKAVPQVSFMLASSVPFVPGVPAIPPALLSAVGTEADAVEPASPAPLAEAAQVRPVQMSIPRGEGGFGSASLRRGMIVSFAALQVFDAVSTRKALSAGAREANPAMAGIAKNSAALFAVKAGSAAATAYFVERLAKSHPRRATIVMVALNAAYAAVVAHNYNVARNAR
jgi:hypothetical protein